MFLRLALHCEHNIEGCQESLEAAASDSTHGERILGAARGPMTCIVAGALRHMARSSAAQTADLHRCMHLAVLVQTQVVGVRRPLGSLSHVSILPINWCWGTRGAHGGDAVPLFQQLHLALAGRALEITAQSGFPSLCSGARPGSGGRLCQIPPGRCGRGPPASVSSA